MADRSFDMEGLSAGGASPDPLAPAGGRPASNSYMDDISSGNDDSSFIPDNTWKSSSVKTEFDALEVPDISDMDDIETPVIHRAATHSPQYSASRDFDALDVPDTSGMSDINTPISTAHKPSPSGTGSAGSMGSSPRPSSGSTYGGTGSSPRPSSGSAYGSTGTRSANSYGSSGSYSSSGSYTPSRSMPSPEQFYANQTDSSKDYENGRTIVMIIAITYAFFHFIGFLADITVFNGLMLAVEIGFAFALFKGVRWAKKWFVIGNYINAVRTFIGISILKGAAAALGMDVPGWAVAVLVISALIDIVAATLIWVDKRVLTYFEYL